MLIKLGLLAAAAVPVIGYALSIPVLIRYEKVHFNNLPSHLRGFKILHIADFHTRYRHKKHIDIWSFLCGLDVDMVAFTGDILLDHPAQLLPHKEGLQNLAKKIPCFYVDGNHEMKCHHEVRAMLEKLGFTVLYNQLGNFALGQMDGSSPVVSVVGFRDYEHLRNSRFAGVDSMLRAMEKSSNFHIILSHQPQTFELLDERIKSALMLVGHTHGGQVRLPFAPTLFAPGQGILPKYGDGWHEKHHGCHKMFISRGVGSTHFPLRIFNPPEVAIIELQRSEGED